MDWAALGPVTHYVLPAYAKTRASKTVMFAQLDGSYYFDFPILVAWVVHTNKFQVGQNITISISLQSRIIVEL